MKYIIVFIVGLLFNVSVSNAQLSLNLTGFATEKISKSIKEGDMVRLKSFFRDDYNNDFAFVSYGGGASELIDLKKISRINFKVKNQKEFWQNQALTNGVYKNIISNGIQYKLRKELEDETIEYINYTKANNLIFNDSYLESYLYAIAYRIYPVNIGDGRPGILNVKVLKSEAPNAFIYPNGTIFITTGLLSTLDSEEELIAVMAHEISHFVLDHQVQNINMAIKRAKRANRLLFISANIIKS